MYTVVAALLAVMSCQVCETPSPPPATDDPEGLVSTQTTPSHTNSRATVSPTLNHKLPAAGPAGGVSLTDTLDPETFSQLDPVYTLSTELGISYHNWPVTGASGELAPAKLLSSCCAPAAVISDPVVKIVICSCLA